MGDTVQIKPAHLGIASVQTDAGSVRNVIKIMLEADPGAGVSAITGLDLGEKIGLMYHMRTKHSLLTVLTDVPKANPKIQTITDLIPGANFHEREVFDLFGVTIVGHPSPGRLVLPDDWPIDLYPLRKDAKLDNLPLKTETPQEKIATMQPEIEGTLVNVVVGPQHPALLEPEKFSLKVDGETVRAVEPRIGYVHRGVEKAAESRTYLQNVYLVERICGICNSCHATCFVETVEKILGTQVPERGKYLRTIILELNRLHSHLLLLGHAGLEIGY
jgi:formate hydrogenlyase subunit 5